MNVARLVQSAFAITISATLTMYVNENHLTLQQDYGRHIPILCLAGAVALLVYGLRSLGLSSGVTFFGLSASFGILIYVQIESGVHLRNTQCTIWSVDRPTGNRMWCSKGGCLEECNRRDIRYQKHSDE